jgi:hypothetical protein
MIGNFQIANDSESTSFQDQGAFMETNPQNAAHLRVDERIGLFSIVNGPIPG